MKNSIIVTLCVVGLLTTACSAPRGPNEQQDMFLGGGGGALAGGLLGAAVGNTQGALIGAGAGALLGGFAGKEYGKSVDQQQYKP